MFGGVRHLGMGSQQNKVGFCDHKINTSGEKFFLKDAIFVNFRGVRGKALKIFQNSQSFKKSPEWSFEGNLIKILQNRSI